jgi:beta-galactosidase
MGYERQSWWSDKPVVHAFRRVAPDQSAVTDPGYEGPANRRAPVFTLFGDWTPQSGAPHEENVEVYSNCADVELFLNGKPLGSKPLPRDASSRNWRVAWEPGILRAACKAEGVSDELKTAGKPAEIVLTADRTKTGTGWDELSYITARVADENGITVPGANPQIDFAITGPGAIAAVDNADNIGHEPFQASSRKAFHGSCIAIVRARAKGGITIRASSPGLTAATVAIAAN